MPAVVGRRCPLAQHPHGNPVRNALHQAAVSEHRVTSRRVSVLLVILQQPAAPWRQYRHAVLVRAVELDLDAERVRQISGLVDPLRRGDQTQATVQRRGSRSDITLMLLEPCKAAPVLGTDPRDQLRIHAHALPQTTDKSEASVLALIRCRYQTSRPLRDEWSGAGRPGAALPARHASVTEGDLPDSSQYGKSSHPGRRMRAVQ